MDPHFFESDRLPPDGKKHPKKRASSPAGTSSWGIQEDAPEPPRDFDRSTGLDGSTFAAPRSTPVLACFLTIWTITAGCSFLVEPQSWVHVLLALSSVPAFFAAVWRFLVWRRYRVHFSDHGIETFGPHEYLGYREIMEVYAPDQESGAAAFDIYVLHSYGFLRIPKTIGPHGRAMVGYLQGQWLAERANPPVPFFLQPFLDKAVYEHGDENVYVYRSHLSLKNEEVSRTGEYVLGWTSGIAFAGMMLTIMVPMLLGRNPDFKEMSLFSQIIFLVVSITFLVGAFGYVILIFRRWFAETLWSVQTFLGLRREAVLIVSPAGIVVQSGKKRIIATWAELRARTNSGVSLTNFDDASCMIEVWRSKMRIRLRGNLNWPVRHAADRIRKWLN